MNLWKNRQWGPMLLKEIAKPFDSNEYLYEIKFDGIRCLLFASPKGVELITRNKRIVTDIYPELEDIKYLVSENTIFDGEIIVIDNRKPSFEKLQERSHLKDKQKISTASKNNPVIFVAFDILYRGRKDLTEMPLYKRKELLDDFIESDYFIKSKVYYEKGTKLFETIVKHDLEGIVAKRKDSVYEISTRSASWIKIKNNKKGKFLIGGYEEKKRGYISCILGEKREGKLYYVGRATLPKKISIFEKVMNSTTTNKSPFVDYENESKYLKKPIECTVVYLEKTKNNHLRQPIIKG